MKLPDSVDYGAMVQQVVSGSAADKAGLKQYDVIVELNGKSNKLHDITQNSIR